ncbi:Protein IN2-1 homolog B (Glutathione S-transferase GSTZ5) [Durusdinium trenchii]|uniref:Protein IN2-1 homolog B (Glutathione S-transferase GSTZ5) n=1 Tax=Durusdinium trenchii TaxID=1381693 RepID=A0ABP0JUY5_9DINO
MGKEVMPSTHRYMKVNFATRKSDKQEVVVKVRFKPSCFRSRQDEKNWRQNTEFLLNLPDSIGVARIYEVMEDPTAFYIVMEKVDGLDLFETLEHMRKIPVATTREIMRHLLESLVFLHAHCAVHKAGIFLGFGSTAKAWGVVASLLSAGENWVGSPKMAQIRRRLKVAKVDFSKEVFQEHADACDLATSSELRQSPGRVLNAVDNSFIAEVMRMLASSKDGSALEGHGFGAPFLLGFKHHNLAFGVIKKVLAYQRCLLIAKNCRVLSWPELEARLPCSQVPEPQIIDSVLQPKKPELKGGSRARGKERKNRCGGLSTPSCKKGNWDDLNGLVLFRERNGWCPYSERVWLALEAKGLDYTTVLVDNYGSRAAWIGGQTPQLQWPSGKRQGESLDIIKALDVEFPDMPKLWPNSAVTELVNAFRSTFPKQTRPSSRAAFLFSWNGPIFRSEFEATLDKTEDLLANHGGPFFHGEQISAADCAWAPFLERYAAQLPCLHRGLWPYDPSHWPRLGAWYEAMDAKFPAYSARIRGDEVSWRKVLAQAGYGNAGVPPDLVEEDAEHPQPSVGAWATYAANRPHVAPTPHEEVANRIVRNREALAKDAVASGVNSEDVDEGLRAVATALLEEPKCLSRRALSLATYLDDRLCVPRDLGYLPGKALRQLVRACQEA